MCYDFNDVCYDKNIFDYVFETTVSHLQFPDKSLSLTSAGLVQDHAPSADDCPPTADSPTEEGALTIALNPDSSEPVVTGGSPANGVTGMSVIKEEMRMPVQGHGKIILICKIY